jgi:hypothetical protein
MIFSTCMFAAVAAAGATSPPWDPADNIINANKVDAVGIALTIVGPLRFGSAQQMAEIMTS